MDSSDEEAFILSIACERVQKRVKEQNRKKRKWIHEMCADRDDHGEYHTLFPHLVRDPVKFYKYFRMSYGKFQELLSLVTDDIKKEETTFRQPIGPEQRLVICLRFLNTGDSFTSLAFNFHVGETTVREIVYETSEAIWKNLSPKVMPTPDTAMWSAIAQRFGEQWDFPNCVGALDGKHVVIEAPGNSGSMFYNYKKTFSIVLMALVDADYRFIAIDVGGYGKDSDSGIFSNSHFGRKILTNTINFPNDQPLPGTEHPLVPYVIVGDEAFPLKKNIMRPYPGAHLRDDEQKKIFNYRLSRARRVSENAFGILSQRFRLYQRRIKMSPKHVDKVVLATCALHNFLRNDVTDLLDNGAQNSINITSQGIQNVVHGNAANEGIHVREMFKAYFNSAAGSVQWQQEMVRLGMRNV